MLVQAVLDLDRAHVLTARDDHVLLAVADRQVIVVVDRAAVAGVEPPTRERVGRGLGLFPVTLQHDVRSREHLALVADVEAHPQRRRARASELLRTGRGGERVPLDATARHPEERRRFRQAVKLYALPT